MQSLSTIKSSSNNEIAMDIDENFYYNEDVDIIDQKTGTVHDGKIISIRGNLLVVKFTEDDEEKIYNKSEGLILKQWHRGREFMIYNRVDVLLPNCFTYWTEGIVIDVDNDKNKVNIRYENKNKEIVDEWILQDSERLAPIGKYSGKFNPDKFTSDEINMRLFSKRKFIQMNPQQENKFRINMGKRSLYIKEVKGDGNCMFRAISVQIYGNEDYHQILREKCMEYIKIERKFFSQFIEGGDASFDEYITMKKTLGVWGDDIELQAMSEIYDRPIEIYANSKKPLKTFHENVDEFNRRLIVEEDEENKNFVKKCCYPIRVSYHGKAHYNTIIPYEENTIQYNLFVCAMIKGKPGEYEDSILQKTKLKNMEEEEENNKKEFQDINKGRELFIEKKDKHLDDILEEDLKQSEDNISNNNQNINNNQNESNHNNHNNNNQNINNNQNESNHNNHNNNNQNDNGYINNMYNQAIIQSELENNDQELLNSVIKLSMETANKDYEQNAHNNPQQDIDYYSIPAIQNALELGFSLDDAVMAYSIYGSSEDLMLQYLYSMKLNNY